MNTLLFAREVTFAYAQRPVLNNVQLALSEGEVLMLLGPNGSGKSTLIRILLGQLRCSGAVVWEGRSLRSWKRRELARRVAYLPQNPTCEPDQRVIDVLRLGRAPYLSAFGIESVRDVRVVEDVARQLELTELFDRRMEELSGGQRQRVFVGRCLVQEPRTLLLDEPSTFLDLRHQVEVCQLLQNLAHQQGIGVLMALHDLNLASAFADRLILLDQGTVAAEGSPARVLDADLLSRLYGVKMLRVDARDGRTVLLPDINLHQ